MPADPNPDNVRETVRTHYAQVVTQSAGCCGPTAGCCGPDPSESLRIGYGADDLAAVPEGANLGLGCGNPHAIAALKPGQTVLDLGSGAGFDCFLAVRAVGPDGRVIGVDMTPEMVQRARANARESGFANVEFRLGEIENLPVRDQTVDVILSNCVINLSPDKARVFAEAFRVLRPGGRLAISDVVATAPIPDDVHRQALALAGCVAGAALVSEIQAWLAQAGFTNIRVDVREESRAFIRDWLPGSGAENYVASATIEAVRPAACCAPGCC